MASDVCSCEGCGRCGKSTISIGSEYSEILSFFQARAASSSSSDPNPSDPPTSLHDEEDPLLRDDMPSAGAGATGTEAGSETGLSTAWKIALLIKCSALGILFSFLLLFLTLLTFALQGAT